MTQQDKELLLKDLCARLPYNVICQVEFKENGKYNSKIMLLSGIFTDEAYFTTKGGSIYSNGYKPYLFPLSSMTEEQHNEFFSYYHNIEMAEVKSSGDYLKAAYIGDDAKYSWLNKNHFDYRGLIEKNLAIDATNLNIY